MYTRQFLRWCNCMVVRQWWIQVSRSLCLRPSVLELPCIHKRLEPAWIKSGRWLGKPRRTLSTTMMSGYKRRCHCNLCQSTPSRSWFPYPPHGYSGWSNPDYRAYSNKDSHYCCSTSHAIENSLLEHRWGWWGWGRNRWAIILHCLILVYVQF